MAGNEGQKANNSGQTRTEQRTTPPRGSTPRAATQPATTEPATTQQPQPPAPSSASGREDPNAIVQLAEALTQQLQAIAAANFGSSGNGTTSHHGSHNSSTSSTVSLLDAQQVRLTTRYGALSNLLGNFGRHGTPRTGIIEPPPVLTDNERLFVGASISGAVTVVTFDFGGNLLQRIPFDNDGVDVRHGDQIQTVEIENSQGLSFLFGFVVREFSEGE